MQDTKATRDRERGDTAEEKVRSAAGIIGPDRPGVPLVAEMAGQSSLPSRAACCSEVPDTHYYYG